MGRMNSTLSKKSFFSERQWSIIASIFLMATSAMGPGFLTQTATFTAKMGAAFGFGILLSIIIDYVVQQNIWRVVTLTQKRASDIANLALPGSGYLLAFLVILGGFFFSIGNIAGAALGLNALFGLDTKWGGVLSGALAIFIFSSRKATLAMDKSMILFGLLKIALIIIVAAIVVPPVGLAVHQTFLPDQIDFAAITTIVGGTVGGYICYAGAHRLLDKGTVGPEHIDEVAKAATKGIIVVGIMRYILFLAILGVVVSGATIDLASHNANPAAQAFQYAAGTFGFKLFGLVFWAAGISSTIGAAYTSVSFMTAFKKNMTPKQNNIATSSFIALALLLFVLWGKAPAGLLIFVGGFNGLVLPIGLTIFMYVAACRKDLMGNYNYPKWLIVVGILTCILTWWMGYISFTTVFNYLNKL
ncbi:NRAMP family divalent metal transporter [Acinetobacter gerneri]|jgi:Mn2+/Fe2+ NRAMP family transporter|nr:NRAMP family divalent metal transporter [Acinetobacter gerneri]MCH4244902.1 divalent metal cation transporter [Acinetobacter gerneri]MDQ9008875.1 divalent metal cation transporter [Acinetobacter gerneri]MDQ9012979.1 divalent metal cation transporter [Acinetobacter gerneri]MDQ9024383.1 divalent metal cation transporter [Acinetobacter gerneri]MDQ9051651.1 divalent metal cation transporter [Acinetobacter gerneri]